MVKVLLPEPLLTGLALKETVEPAGNPLTPKFTAPVKPPEGVIVAE